MKAYNFFLSSFYLVTPVPGGGSAPDDDDDDSRFVELERSVTYYQWTLPSPYSYYI